MVFGLTDAQAIAIIAPAIGGIVTAINYYFQFDKHENTRIAADAESDRWEIVKEHYGRIVSGHYTQIQNTANIFIDLTDPNISAEAMEETIDDTADLVKLCNLIIEMNRPKKYNSRCRKGAEWAPWAFLLALLSGAYSIFQPQAAFGSYIFLAIAFLLTIVFLYYRAKLNGLTDETQFRV